MAGGGALGRTSPPSRSADARVCPEGRPPGSLPSQGRQGDGDFMAYVYKVVELREKMIGGKMSGGRLEKVLNDHASEGWQLKAITATDVKGRVGPGGVEGMLITFERAA